VSKFNKLLKERKNNFIKNIESYKNLGIILKHYQRGFIISNNKQRIRSKMTQI
jgi:hypothetical protein